MTATTVPQIVPGTLTGDLDITSFTVEHYPGDALGIAVRAPRMNWTYSHTVPEDAQILLTLTRRVPGSKPREEKTYLPADDRRACALAVRAARLPRRSVCHRAGCLRQSQAAGRSQPHLAF